MDDDRIAQICILGDKLADYTRLQGGKSFFCAFFTEHRTGSFMTLLTKTNIAYVKLTRGTDVLFDLDGYLAVFMDALIQLSRLAAGPRSGNHTHGRTAPRLDRKYA